MIRMLLPGTPSREDGRRTCFVWLNADQAEIESWLMARVAFVCASSIAVHPACTLDIDEVCFWDAQTVLADVVELDEDIDIDEIEFLEDEKDYTEAENMRISSMRAHVDDEGVYWSWWAKHSDIRYTSRRLLWTKIKELIKKGA